MRHDAGTRTSPRPVSSNQYSCVSEIVAGFSNLYSAHSVVPFVGHQSKYDDGSFEAAGTSPSLIARGFFLPETVTLLVVAMVGQEVGLAFASLLGIHTTIWPRPRFAHVAYGIAVSSSSVFTSLP